MRKKGSPNKATGLKPHVKIITTHPDGESVRRYKEILQRRREHRNSETGEVTISLDRSNPRQIVRAAMYAGLEHHEELEEEEMLERHGEDSDYALVINRAAEEMVLFVDGESHPMRPVEREREVVHE